MNKKSMLYEVHLVDEYGNSDSLFVIVLASCTSASLHGVPM